MSRTPYSPASSNTVNPSSSKGDPSGRKIALKNKPPALAPNATLFQHRPINRPFLPAFTPPLETVLADGGKRKNEVCFANFRRITLFGIVVLYNGGNSFMVNIHLMEVNSFMNLENIRINGPYLSPDDWNWQGKPINSDYLLAFCIWEFSREVNEVRSRILWLREYFNARKAREAVSRKTIINRQGVMEKVTLALNSQLIDKEEAAKKIRELDHIFEGFRWGSGQSAWERLVKELNFPTKSFRNSTMMLNERYRYLIPKAKRRIDANRIMSVTKHCMFQRFPAQPCNRRVKQEMGGLKEGEVFLFDRKVMNECELRCVLIIGIRRGALAHRRSGFLDELLKSVRERRIECKLPLIEDEGKGLFVGVATAVDTKLFWYDTPFGKWLRDSSIAWFWAPFYSIGDEFDDRASMESGPDWEPDKAGARMSDGLSEEDAQFHQVTSASARIHSFLLSNSFEQHLRPMYPTDRPDDCKLTTALLALAASRVLRVNAQDYDKPFVSVRKLKGGEFHHPIYPLRLRQEHIFELANNAKQDAALILPGLKAFKYKCRFESCKVYMTNDQNCPEILI